MDEFIALFWPEDATDVLVKATKKIAPIEALVKSIPEDASNVKIIIKNFKQKHEKKGTFYIKNINMFRN
jgi:hypothetical protein